MLTPPDSDDGDRTDDGDWQQKGLEALREATWKKRPQAIEAYDARAALFEQRLGAAMHASQRTAGSQCVHRSRASPTPQAAPEQQQRSQSQKDHVTVSAAHIAAKVPRNLFNRIMHQSMTSVGALASDP